MPAFTPPGYCPVCGEYVEAKATACPGCGSCPRSGWSEETDYDGLDLPEEGADPRPAGKPSAAGSLGATLLAIVLVGLFLYYFVL